MIIQFTSFIKPLICNDLARCVEVAGPSPGSGKSLGAVETGKEETCNVHRCRLKSPSVRQNISKDPHLGQIDYTRAKIDPS